MSARFQIVWECTAILLILLAVGILTGSSSLRDRLDLLQKAPPICLPLDLSSRRVYSGAYNRSFAAPLDDRLRLVIAGSPSATETKKLLSGLAALVVLRDEAGRVVSEQVVGAQDFHEWGAYQKTGLVITLPLAKTKHQAGNYDLSIEVTTPAKGMAGHAHCIVAELGLCGVEVLAAYLVGLPAGWIALLVGVIILVVRRRKREKAPEAAMVASTSLP
jgi:hypothetical protein